MARTAVIMQPTYLPWLGYFDLIDQSDVFVFLDTAQFSKQSWHQRNRIRTAKGLEWLTVPVQRTGRFPFLIRDAEIATGLRFPEQHIRGIELNYQRAPHFKTYFRGLHEILADGEVRLCPLNMRLILWLGAQLGVDARFEVASELRGEGRRSELMVDICERLGADLCLSPIGSAAYLAAEYEPARGLGVNVVFQNYEHPTYRQVFDPFLPYASVLDLLFNEGDRSLDIIRSGRRKALPMREALDRVRRLEAGQG